MILNSSCDAILYACKKINKDEEETAF